jgi:hypothetical protein
MIRDPSDDIQRVNAGADSSRRARPRWLKQTLSEHAPRMDRYRAAAVNEFRTEGTQLSGSSRAARAPGLSHRRSASRSSRAVPTSPTSRRRSWLAIPRSRGGDSPIEYDHTPERNFGASAKNWNAAVSKSVYRSACSSPHSRRVYFQMPSKSRSAAGESRYSAIYAAELTWMSVGDCLEADARFEPTTMADSVWRTPPVCCGENVSDGLKFEYAWRRHYVSLRF